MTIGAVEAGPQWSSTAIFVTYDDCGCFYDHVPPGYNPNGFRQGVRVPMVIASPYAKVAYTDSHTASFASVLRFTEETFGLPALGINDLHAYDYANSFDFSQQPLLVGPRMVHSFISQAEIRRLAKLAPLHANDPA